MSIISSSRVCAKIKHSKTDQKAAKSVAQGMVLGEPILEGNTADRNDPHPYNMGVNSSFNAGSSGFDWYQGSIRRSQNEVVEALKTPLVGHFEHQLEIHDLKPRYGFRSAAQIVHNQEKVMDLFWYPSWTEIDNEGRDISPTITHFQITGGKSNDLAQIIKQQFPDHTLSRVDVRHDFIQEWDVVESVLKAWALDNPKIKLEPAGDHFRKIDGRTWYVGSRASDYFIRIYEKGIKLQNDHGRNITCREHIRIELVYRPKKLNKELAAIMEPDDIWRSSKWAFKLLNEFVPIMQNKIDYLKVKEPPKLHKTMRHMYEQYKNVMKDYESEYGKEALIHFLMKGEI